MSLRKNYLYNLTYQVLLMVLPLITVPYVSRVLLPNGVGTFAYTSSIVNYFTLLGMLGIGTYGNKKIAESRDNKKLMSQNFISIYTLQCIFSIISLILYLLLVKFFMVEDQNIAYIQAITLLGTLTDCSWLFIGLEQFKKIVTRNLIVKLASLTAIFIFVKNPNDLGIYTLIMCLSMFLGSLVMWLYVKGILVFVKISWHSIIIHLKPTISYFLPQIAVQIYTVLDKTMIGILSTNSEVGLYDYANKITSMTLALVTSLGTIMLPRVTHTLSLGHFNEAKQYLVKALDFTALLSISMMFGIAGISREFVPWFMGDSFNKCVPILIITSPVIFFIAWSVIFSNQYFVPLGKMREYNLSLYFGAVVNFVINLLLIRNYGSIGAAFGTLAAEFSVTGIEIAFVRKQIPWRKILPQVILYTAAGWIMYLGVRMIGNFRGISVITTFIQIIIGAILYLAIVLTFEWKKGDGILLNELDNRIAAFKRKKG